MNIDRVNELQSAVAQLAVARKWRRIPQLQIPFVEYVVPSEEDAKKALADMQWRLAGNPNFEAKLVVKGAQTRVRVEYRT